MTHHPNVFREQARSLAGGSPSMVRGRSTSTTYRAWALALVALSFDAVAAILYWRNELLADGVFGPHLFLVPGFALVGAAIVAKASNRVGWLLLATAFGASLLALGGQYGAYAEITGTAPVPVDPAWGIWLGNVMWPLTYVALPGLLLLFPTGRLLSRLWRVVAAALALGFGGLAVLSAVDPVQHFGDGSVANPVGIEALPGARYLWPSLIFLGFGAAAVSCIVPILRYWRADGEERLQLRWFAFTVATILAAAVVVASLPALRVGLLGVVAGGVLFALVCLGLPLAIGLAVVKHRLYDIDVVISKTVVFAGLAGFITVVYVGIVVGVGGLIGAGGEPNLGLSIVATAVVAVAFQPVRDRLTRVANRLVYGRRATPYEVLSRFSSQIGDTVATEQTLGRMARLLAEGTGSARAQVWLKASHEMRPAASWPEGAVRELAAVVNPDGSLPEFAEVDLAVPVSHDGQLLGALTITKKRGEPLTPTERSLVDDLAGQAGLVLRNVGLTAELLQRLDELRDSRRRLVEAQDQERRRLERDLHDGAQQQLVALKIKLGLAKRLAERDGATQAAQLVDQLTVETDEAVAALRELAHGIYPPLLAAEGLEGALRARAVKAPIPVVVEADGVVRYSQEVEAAVYFCVLEAIQNAAKYAHASQVTVKLEQADGQLTFEVADDGAGFDPTTTPKGHGLTNITDRLDALGGNLTLDSGAGAGTSVRGTVPVAATHPMPASR